MAGSQVTASLDQITKQRLGYQALSLTNFTSDILEPQICAGSKIEVEGSLFEFSALESISGWTAISVSTQTYIYVSVSGSSITALFSTTAPTWDTAKQGWYNGTSRAIGGCYKDSSGNYARKFFLEDRQITIVRRYGSGGAEIAFAPLGEGSTVLSGAASWVVPAGVYVISTDAGAAADALIQFYINGSWKSSGININLSIGYMVFSDGVNVRAIQTSGTTTLRWRRMA